MLKRLLTLFITIQVLFLVGCSNHFAKDIFSINQKLTPKEQCTAWRRQLLYNSENLNQEAAWTTRSQKRKLAAQYRINNCNKVLGISSQH